MLIYFDQHDKSFDWLYEFCCRKFAMKVYNRVKSVLLTKEFGENFE